MLAFTPSHAAYAALHICIIDNSLKTSLHVRYDPLKSAALDYATKPLNQQKNKSRNTLVRGRLIICGNFSVIFMIFINVQPSSKGCLLLLLFHMFKCQKKKISGIPRQLNVIPPLSHLISCHSSAFFAIKKLNYKKKKLIQLRLIQFQQQTQVQNSKLIYKFDLIKSDHNLVSGQEAEQ